ncbi:MAG: hypothetical protein Q9174_006834 [Haloplaca sp. 1 TL-2023]
MVEYEYSSLNEEAGEIRLFTLLPGPFDAPIHIRIEQTVLSEDNVPQFEALSYAWGDPSDWLDIFVQMTRTPDVETAELVLVSSTILSITRNLFDALQHIRQQRRSMVLWIDQICVNQKNLTERGNQVLRMPDIYSLALGVTVWLGPESKESDIAMKIFNTLGPQISMDWTLWKCNVDSSSSLYAHGLVLGSEQRLSIVNILSRPWFRRLWVVQEVCLTNAPVTMICGLKTVFLDDILSAVFYLRDYGHGMHGTTILMGAILKIARLRYSAIHGNDLSWVLRVTRDRECSDARDRIYAILSLLLPDWRLDICPDYTTSAAKVFTGVVLRSLERQASLYMLMDCSLKDRAVEVPSWVPDWSVDPKLKDFGVIQASLFAKASAYSISNDILLVTGVCVTVIHEVMDELPGQIPEDRLESAKVFRRLLSNVVGKDVSKLLPLCVVLSAGSLSDAFIPSDTTRPSFSDVFDYLHRLYTWSLSESTEPHEMTSSSVLVIHVINSMINGRSLITTADGRLGLAPKGTVPGDTVTVVLGCDAPLVLRSTGELSCQVVGACYIDGLMAGQALLGELPSKWTVVSKYFPEHNGHLRAFLEGDTGKTYVRDPRLGPLPAGWRIKDHGAENAISLYVNDITGEDAGYRDPRLEPDALRARGVNLQEFRLV